MATPLRHDHEILFVLVSPFCLDRRIYAWGSSCIQSYLQAQEPRILTTTIDLRGDDFTRELRRRYAADIAFVLGNLKADQPAIMGDTPEAVLGVVAGLGERFVPVARDAGLFKSRLAARRVGRNSVTAVKKLAAEVDEYFLAKIQDQLETSAGRPTVWGLSVYDSSMVSSLQFARAIRKLDPASPIIFGGGYFNATFAREFIDAVDPDLADGIVVGRGEDAVLQILRAHNNGIPPAENRISGFFSRNDAEGSEASSTGKEAVFLPPENPETSSWMPENPVVQDNIVHVMPQRGCNWGRCTFCDKFDRGQPAYEILRDDFFPRLTETIASLSARPNSDQAQSDDLRLSVHLDGDDTNPDTFAKILKHIAAVNQSSGKVAVRGWVQTKNFTEDLGRELFACQNDISTIVDCTAESFNFDTLRAMKKGHTPLHAVHAMKSIVDTGHTAFTYVFMHYPREGFRGVEEEIKLASRIYHLLCSNNTEVEVITYLASEVDDVFHNQEKFQLTVRRRKGDVWLRNAFNVDLPLRHMSALAQENRPFGIEGIVVARYARAIEALVVLVKRHSLLRSLDPRRGRLRMKAILARFDITEILLCARAFGRMTTFFLVTRLAGRVYWRRLRFWMHIKARSSNKQRGNSAARRNDAASGFFLRGHVLTKDHQGWGREENWQYTLNDNELAVLRYLYKVRKKRGLFDRFRGSLGDSEVAKILRRQIELGSVVESHGSLLCVVNDPEYWEYEAGRWD